jgi:oligosaccharyltransferase complex subunit alpha (ribophorin I)
VQGVVNTDVSQVIDASTSIVRYSAEVKAAKLGNEYRLVFPQNWAEHLSFLSVTSKEKSLKVFPPVSAENYTSWTIDLTSIVSGSTAAFKIQAAFSSLLIPYPAEITQLENQLVLLHTSHYFLSPYTTQTQKTVVKLASTTIESFTKIAAHSVRGSSIHFGPFKDIAPFQFSPLAIHSVNNYPFAKFSTMQREVEVSHWGSIAIEDLYEVQHAGAKLRNGFSRFDYQMRRQGSVSPSFRSLTALLPVEAHDIYYRDQIGNISTSDLKIVSSSHSSSLKQLELEIQTRFPLFGGWQTQFYMGFSIPTELSLFRTAAKTQSDSSNNDHFRLQVPFFTYFQNVWVDEMEVKVILPEGARDIAVHVPHEMKESRSVRYTYLDSKLNGGRPVITLTAHNLVPEHVASWIQVEYSYPRYQWMVEPCMLIVLFFLLFVFASLVARTTGIAMSRANSNNNKSGANSAANSANNLRSLGASSEKKD